MYIYSLCVYNHYEKKNFIGKKRGNYLLLHNTISK